MMRFATFISALVGGLLLIAETPEAAEMTPAVDLTAAHQEAPIRILTSRVIYDEDAGAAALSLENNSTVPLLVALSVSPFQSVGTAAKETEDFMASPGIRLIRPDDTYAFRIVRLRDDLPKDVESLYIINLRILPAEAAASAPVDELSRLKLSFLGSIKLFWRPKALANAFGVEEAKSLLGAGCFDRGLELRNPSPYWCTVSSVRLLSNEASDGIECIRTTVLPMIAPNSTLTLPVRSCPKKVSITLIAENGQTTLPRILTPSQRSSRATPQANETLKEKAPGDLSTIFENQGEP